MARWLLVWAFVVVSMGAQAQVSTILRQRQPALIWVNNGTVRLNADSDAVVLRAEKNKPTEKILNGSDLELEVVFDFFEGRAIASRNSKTGDVLEIVHIGPKAKEVDARWKVDLKSNKNLPALLLPLENGKYLGFAFMPSFMEGKQGYPMAILRPSGEDRQLQVESCFTFDLSIPEPYTRLNASNAAERLAISVELSRVQPVRTPKHLFAVYANPGYITVFRARDGRLLREVKVFPSITDKERFSQKTLPCILGFQPTRDGDLLFATRGEDAVRHGVELERLYQAKWRERGGISSSDFQMLQQSSLEAREATNKAHPQIYWWRLNPEQGTLQEVAAPKNAPRSLAAFRTEEDFHWILNEDESIRLLTSQQVGNASSLRQAEKRRFEPQPKNQGKR